MEKTKLEKLMEVINKEGIFLEYVSFHEIIQGLFYKAENCPPVIGINESIVSDKKLFLIVLAEEVGHYFTTIGDTTGEYYSYKSRLTLNKQEALALKWATEFLLPVDEIVKGIRDKSLNFSELADFLGVTDDFLFERFKFLSQNKNYIKADNNTYINLNNLPNISIVEDYYKNNLSKDEILMVAED